MHAGLTLGCRRSPILPPASAVRFSGVGYDILCQILGVAVAVFFLGFQEGAGRMILIRDLGIPLGLTGSLIGAIQAMNGILLNGSGEGVYSATAVMLLTTLYGGAASAVGFFFWSGAPATPQYQAP